MMRNELMAAIRRHGDEALAAALTALFLLEVALSGASDAERFRAAFVTVALGLAAARRVRTPLVFLGLLVAIAVATVVMTEVDAAPPGTFLLLLLAVYSAAAHTEGIGTLLAGLLTVALYVIDLVAIDPVGINPEGAVFYALLYGAPWAAGRAVRSRRLKEGELERERAMAGAAIAEERARIARELHDVVAHSISVMVLHARGGRRMLEPNPADASDAFDVIERTGHQALEEMRRLLAMLRRSEDEIALAPQPSLRHMSRIIDQIEEAGLPVDLVVEGEPRELPPGVDLSAYRIVQEALTNALKHAGPARARVLLRYHIDCLELEISDDGRGTGDGISSGYGLIGMRERVSVYGGELQAGRRPGGGYALRVRLPLRSVRT